MREVPVIVISSLMFTGAGVGVHAEAAVYASAAVASGPRLKVSLSSGRHAISRYIYGMNFAGAKFEGQLRLPVVRWGGNATTRYNYPLDTANHAAARASGALCCCSRYNRVPQCDWVGLVAQ